MIDNGYPYIMLDTQYRMNYEICTFPSDYFYDSKLITHHETVRNCIHHDWIDNVKSEVFKFKSLVFVNIDGTTIQEETSYHNFEEINVIVDILKLIPEDKHHTIGIISPYKKQCFEINKRLLFERFFQINVNTVDSFQGREKEIILMSLVKS